MRNYYAISGSFVNAMIVSEFPTMAERDDWVENSPDNSMMQSHFDHNRRKATRREVDRLRASNRKRARDHKYNSGLDENFGTV